MTHRASDVQLRPFAGEPDFPRMAEVANASFAADGIAMVRTAGVMRADYAAMSSFDPVRSIVMAQIGDRLVGYARTWPFTTSEGFLVQPQVAFVHPDFRRRGVGTALLRCMEDHARQVAAAHPRATAWLHQAMVTEGERDRAHLLESSGYRVVRHFLEMERPTLEDIPDFALPPGFEARPVEPAHLRAIFDAHMEALRDHWGFAPPDPGDFEHWKAARTCQPHLWQVAWHAASNQVAGQVKPWIDAEQNATLGRRRGFTEFISVGKPWRRQGLARALVSRALHAQKAAGMDESALGVDGESAFNAARLYEACGFRIAKRNALYRKPVGPAPTA
ncbi:GNAT family N-acetyltransferase [Ramlibacter humi]|uniref:GNAT family N-acetyltransferase n=1 Tax=Ramlibacter humi TaxID=2530451 RepID=A0A4Z0BL61_9BURK|nr:GNAT family N-acetyltransferase [Ramlibacter humi]TFZ00056.1 GNAT family N-acetyltransferase [Ramlibacter humi]